MAGLGWVSGSATRVSLTDGHTDGLNRRGFFFRVVPNDGVQGPTVANYITGKLKAKRVYIVDDQETYSQGLADGVQAILKAQGVNVTRDSVAQTRVGLLLADREDPGRHAGRLHPVAARPAGAGASASS